MKHLIFKYRKEITRDNIEVYRPIAHIYVEGRDKNWYYFDPYVDSGADLPLFTRGDCLLLGHKIEKGIEKFIGGVSGSLIRCFIHKVNMRLGEWTFETNIAFAELEEVPRLLGRIEAFLPFRICFEEKNKETHFWLLSPGARK